MVRLDRLSTAFDRPSPEARNFRREMVTSVYSCDGRCCTSVLLLAGSPLRDPGHRQDEPMSIEAVLATPNGLRASVTRAPITPRGPGRAGLRGSTNRSMGPAMPPVVHNECALTVAQDGALWLACQPVSSYRRET